MELILWRHAEAEPGDPDAARTLTARGHKQALRMAEWLDATLPNSCRVFCSPTRRTIQTAEALGRKFKVSAELAPESTVERILTVANWPDSRDPVLIVGHQPALGQLAALLIAGNQQDWTIRKANAWWIMRRERAADDDPCSHTGNYLRAVMTPDLVRK